MVKKWSHFGLIFKKLLKTKWHYKNCKNNEDHTFISTVLLDGNLTTNSLSSKITNISKKK